jgi:hypothetical protein
MNGEPSSRTPRLHQWGHSPHVALTTTEALVAAEVHQPQVILLNPLGSKSFRIAAELCEEAGLCPEQFLITPANSEALQLLLSTWPPTW